MARARRHEAAFSDYVMGSQDRLRRVAYALCGDWHLADDLLQEALTKLYLAWPRLREDHHPDAYVRTILVRTSIDAHRKRQRRVHTVALAADQDVAHGPGTPLEERDALITALQSLPEQQRRSWCCATGSACRSARPPPSSASTRAPSRATPAAAWRVWSNSSRPSGTAEPTHTVGIAYGLRSTFAYSDVPEGG